MGRSVQRFSCVFTAMVAVALMFLVAPAGSAAASAGSPSGIDAGRPELQRLLDGIVAAGSPGVIALVDDGHARQDGKDGHGDGIWTAGSGVADVRTGRPIRASDRFRVASVTKPFVATVVLQLVAEGRLSLQDTVERWLPGMLPYGDQITVRQLLNHTSGVPDYVLTPIVELYRGNRLRSWQPQELIALVADRPPDFPAGTRWSYSNTGYVLAGLIVERVTGNRLGRELARRIFRPLGLRDTSFPTDFPLLIGPHARGYSLPFDDQMNPIEGPLFDITVYNPSLAWSAGAIVSDVDDLARFFRALLDGRLLPAELLADMKSPTAIAPGFGYGLGLLVVDSPCGPLFGHDGGIPGYTNIVLSSEDARHQYALMMNANEAPAAAQALFDQAIFQAGREAFAGDPCAAPAPRFEARRQMPRLRQDIDLRRAGEPAAR
jgi:D-alanyl-D-alanine carboxypeptidase